MSDQQAGGAAGEAAGGDQGAGFAEALRLQIAGRVEHLLHARPAARSLIADDDDVAGLDLVAEDRLDGSALALEDAGRTGELQDRLVDAGGLHDAAVERQVALQHGKAAVLRERRLGRADDARFTVRVELVPAAVLTEGDLRRHAAGSGAEEVADVFGGGTG